MSASEMGWVRGSQSIQCPTSATSAKSLRRVPFFSRCAVEDIKASLHSTLRLNSRHPKSFVGQQHGGKMGRRFCLRQLLR
jgi:predicted alpha/beta hydrolase